MTNILLFAVVSGLSMNLVLQCGLGIRSITIAKQSGTRRFLVSLAVMFLSNSILWVVFTYVLSIFSLGFYTCILIFPASSLVSFGLEHLARRFIPRCGGEGNSFRDHFHNGLTAAALFITLQTASGFGGALILSLGFAAGVLVAHVIIGEIRRRAAFEAVPQFLRGRPLTLIAMGLLSLVFSAASIILLRTLGSG
jgi:electron transport complex protein RnfA